MAVAPDPRPLVVRRPLQQEAVRLERRQAVPPDRQHRVHRAVPLREGPAPTGA